MFAKSETLRVATMRLFACAVAAIKESAAAFGSGMCMRAATNAVSSQNGRMRLANCTRTWPSNQDRNLAACIGSVRCLSWIPFSISKTEMEEIKTLSSGSEFAQPATPACTRPGGLRNSPITLVSSKYLKSRRSAARTLLAVDQNRCHLPASESMPPTLSLYLRDDGRHRSRARRAKVHLGR